MKIAVFFSILFLFGCTNDYKVEDELCTCYRSVVLEDEEFSFDGAFEHLELYLIEKKVLDSKDGKSYKDRVNSLCQNPNYLDSIDIQFSLLRPYLDWINQSMSFEKCAQLFVDIDSSSKVKRLIAYWKNKNNLGKVSVYEGFKEILTEKDFEHPYYKFLFIQSVFAFTHIEDGIGSLLPLKPVNNEFSI